MSKYYKIIIPSLVVVCIILLIILLMPSNEKETVNQSMIIEEKKVSDELVDIQDIVFKLKGAVNYELDVDTEYTEPGYVAYLKSGLDLTDCVNIINDNIIENGSYKIKYVLEYENIKLTLTRKITLINKKAEIEEETKKEEIKQEEQKQEETKEEEKTTPEQPKTEENTITMKLNGEDIVYVLKGNLYKEKQASAIDKKDGDISANIKTIGMVNTSRLGEYQIVYTVQNSKNQTKSVKRKVVVYDYNYDITVNKVNNNVNLVITNTDDYIKYITINNQKYNIDKKVTNLTIEDNKEYTIKIYDKYNYVKEEKYNFVKPVLSCNATVDSSNTIVTTSISSNNIVKYNYYFNNQRYESAKNTYTIVGKFNNVYVEAIDSNNNSSKVKCKVSEVVQYFDSGLKDFTYNGWNYYLYVPKNVKKNEKKPLIVFLHGSEERGSDIKSLEGYGFPKYIKKGQEYNAFILVPQLPKNKYWSNEEEATMKLIKKVVNDYNIDEDKISLSGFSLGAMGMPNIIKKNQNYFSCAVLIACGGNKKGFASYFKNIPVRFYAGSKDTKFGNSSDTKAFINAVKKVNSNVSSTVFKNAPHNVVNKTLEDGSVAKWMIEQTK